MEKKVDVQLNLAYDRHQNSKLPINIKQFIKSESRDQDNLPQTKPQKAGLSVKYLQKYLTLHP